MNRYVFSINENVNHFTGKSTMNSTADKKEYQIIRLLKLNFVFFSLMICSLPIYAQRKVDSTLSPIALSVNIENIIIKADSMIHGLIPNFPSPVLSTITVFDSAGNFVKDLADTSRWLGPNDIAQIGLSISEIWNPIIEYHAENPIIPKDPNLYNQIPEPVFKEIVQDMHVPTSTMLVMDVSTSMTEKLEDAKFGARLYVEQLRSVDRAGIILFNHEVVKFQKFTNDKTLLFETINSATTEFGTAINDALVAAIQETKHEKSRPRIIIYTDGVDNNSNYTPIAIIDSAQVYNIPIYTIALGNFTIRDTLKQIADMTGGLFFKVDSAKQMSDVYQKLADLIKHIYLMAHTSPDPIRNNTWRTVDVAVNLPKSYGNHQLRGVGKYFVEGGIPADLSVKLASITDTTIIEANNKLNAVKPGDNYQYQIKVKNLGPNQANYVKISLIIPDLVRLINTAVQPFVIKDSLIVWQFNNFETNDEMNLAVAVQLPPGISTDLHDLISTIELIGDNDYNTENNFDKDTVLVYFPQPVQNYDLSISQLAITDSIAVVRTDTVQVVFNRENIDYILTVENSGKTTAKNFTVINVLHDSVKILDFSMQPVKLNGDSLFWQFDSLPAGESLKISLHTVAADTFPNDLYPLSNISQVIAEKDTFEQNNIATTTVYGILRHDDPQYDLYISQLAITDSIAVIGNDTVQVVFSEGTIDYILTVENSGPSTAKNFIVMNVLPDSARILDFSLQPTRQIADTLFWQFDSLPAGKSLKISFHTVIADTFTVNLSPLINISQVVAEKDIFEQNNIATTTVYGILHTNNQPFQYDLSISQLAITDSIVVVGEDTAQVVLNGGTIDYVLTVENLGPGTAYNFNVWNVIPNSVNIFNTSLPSTRQIADTLFWHFDTLAVGKILNISFSDKVAESFVSYPFPIINTSGVNADKDTFKQNNIATTTVYAISKSDSLPLVKVDISICQSVSTDSFAVVESDTIRFAKQGEIYSYSIIVKNNCLGTAQSVSLVDKLPDSVSVKNFQQLPNLITKDSLVWNLGDLSALSSFRLKFNVIIPSKMPIGTNLLINKVTANATNEDVGYLTNNTAVDTVFNIVKPLGDLLPIIQANPPIVDIGDEISVRVQVLYPIQSWDIWVHLADGSIDYNYADQFIVNTKLAPNTWYDIDQKYKNTKLFTSAEQEQIVFELHTVDIFGTVRTAQTFITVMSNNEFYLDHNVFEIQRLEPLGIHFKLSSNRVACLDLFDISGKKITNLTEKPYQAGWNTFQWSGMLENGLRVGSGLYLITLKSGNYNEMKKVMIVQ